MFQLFHCYLNSEVVLSTGIELDHKFIFKVNHVIYFL